METKITEDFKTKIDEDFETELKVSGWRDKQFQIEEESKERRQEFSKCLCVDTRNLISFLKINRLVQSTFS